MFEQVYKGRGGFRGSPRGGRGRGGWGNQGGGGGYYGAQMDGYRGGRGGGHYRGGRGAGGGGGQGAYRTNDISYRLGTGGGGGYRGSFRGNMQQGTYGGGGGRGGSYHSGGVSRGRGGMGGGVYRGGQNYRGGIEQRLGPMNKPRMNSSYNNKKSDMVVFEENLDFDQRKRMVKITCDNRLQRADFEEIMNMEGVVDLHVTGHMLADFKDSDEDLLLDTFRDVEDVAQNGVPCYVDIMGKRSKNFGREAVRDLKRVDLRNLAEKTSVDTVKEAFPAALAVWKNKYNIIEMLFANEEEACEAILSGQQKELDGVLPYVMFHRENQADLTKTVKEPEVKEPPAKRAKLDDDANGEGATEAAQEENGEEETEA